MRRAADPRRLLQNPVEDLLKLRPEMTDRSAETSASSSEPRWPRRVQARVLDGDHGVCSQEGERLLILCCEHPSGPLVTEGDDAQEAFPVQRAAPPGRP